MRETEMQVLLCKTKNVEQMVWER